MLFPPKKQRRPCRRTAKISCRAGRNDFKPQMTVMPARSTSLPCSAAFFLPYSATELPARRERPSRQHSVHAAPEVARRSHAQKAFRVEMRDLFPVEVADRQLVQEVNRGCVRLVRPIDGKKDAVGPKR